jgi:hypothetical protein
MNPPYNKPENACKKNCTKKKCKERGYHLIEALPGIGSWVEKAYLESQQGMDMICLLPGRIDTIEWWHKYCMHSDRIDIIEGRIHFTDCAAPKAKPTPAAFPSVIVYFLGKTNKNNHPKKPIFNSLHINRKTGEIKVE